ncbi:phosphatidylinositol:udp-c transferase pig-c [Niveomyces insectorum RCEF 264]|uniref:Phosphatidylinositol:udp-c transferase pig-c n=1 Tax=Niveomyces insectorum RCEF 264 TaxID=1081102 RepID=A0A167WBS5_9HYPO|nr:phosphatidylinositol:udp-c transferase pig-c [Niveomyces insectorum RCEF 264]
MVTAAADAVPFPPAPRRLPHDASHSGRADEPSPPPQQPRELPQPVANASTLPPPPSSDAFEDGPPFPQLVRASTVPASLRSSSLSAATRAVPGINTAAAAAAAAARRTDPYHLAPEDAFNTSVSPPWDRTAKTNISSTNTTEQHHQQHQRHHHHQQQHQHHHHRQTTSSNLSGSELRESRTSRQFLRPGGGGSSTGLGRGASRGGPRGGGADSRSRSRRRRRTWRKLMWVKQSYPDNYTDQATFLEHLQRNPRLQPYDFWPLVADSTVIVQHVCSVIIFVVCFVGIFQDRVSPVSVVGGGSIATCMGWLLWEWWAGQEQRSEDGVGRGGGGGDGGSEGNIAFEDGRSPHGPPRRHRETSSSSSNNNNNVGATVSGDLSPPARSHAQPAVNQSAPKPSAADAVRIADLQMQPPLPPAPLSSSARSSTTSLLTMADKPRPADQPPPPPMTPVVPGFPPLSGPSPATAQSPAAPPRRPLTPRVGGRDGRSHHRMATIKSAVLIYFTLLGLSPILKSLTRSTSSDSIWAMSFWLLAINIFFFDYSGVWVGGAHRFPVASLSTNAALMASTVLASRLPSTGQVFSLTLFSIEVFGLFPVFRRYARHRSWRYHVVLTVLLVLGAGAGVGIVLTGAGPAQHQLQHQHPYGNHDYQLPWRSAVAGMVVACLLSAVAMGGCSWWLIGLQKYKNEIYGPWDPARPIIISRRHWSDV